MAGRCTIDIDANAKRAANYDEALEQAVQSWIEGITGELFPDSPSTFAEGLKDVSTALPPPHPPRTPSTTPPCVIRRPRNVHGAILNLTCNGRAWSPSSS